jgi:hypothetical protein
MLRYGGASVGARDRETADGPAGSSAVRGRRVRELHVAGADFKGGLRCARRLGKARRARGRARGRARRSGRRNITARCQLLQLALFESKILQKFE